jgi:hypothetical protein
MSAAIVAILGKERAVLRAFRQAGATDAASARTLDEIGLRPGLGLRRLRNRAVIRVARPEHYFLDEEVWDAVHRSRRRLTVMIFVAMVLFFAARLVLLSPTLTSSR